MKEREQGRKPELSVESQRCREERLVRGLGHEALGNQRGRFLKVPVFCFASISFSIVV